MYICIFFSFFFSFFKHLKWSNLLLAESTNMAAVCDTLEKYPAGTPHQIV